MRIPLFPAVLLAFGACSTTDNTELANVQVSFATQAPAPALSLVANDTINEGGNVLVITRAEIVLREIELKRVNHDACDSIVGDDDSCEEFEIGPILVDLPLGGAVETVLSVAIDTGTYGELEFELHKPEDDDTAFLSAHPDFAETTIRVTGSFNGTAFVYETDLNVEQELDLVPPLTITDAAVATNVTSRTAPPLRTRSVNVSPANMRATRMSQYSRVASVRPSTASTTSPRGSTASPAPR